MTEERLLQLKTITKEMRIDILNMCHGCGRNNAHLGGCLSMVEILAVLFLEIIKIKNVKPNDARDRFVLSKGHAGIAMYAALKQIGVLSQEEINQPLRGTEAILFRHPKRNPDKYIEMTAGSLGQGLSYGVGLALAAKKKSFNRSKTFVVLGDGECNEGSIWEAAAFASHNKLSNLIVIIDKNNLQLDGFTNEIMNMDNLEKRWASFGFDTVSLDGHDVSALYTALSQNAVEKPLAIIANTTKGKGVSFAENAPQWHDGFLSDNLYETALKEVENACF